MSSPLPVPPAVTVTVAHIPLTKDMYYLILSTLEAEEFEFGKHSRIDDARRWLHYRWLLEQGKQGDCHQ